MISTQMVVFATSLNKQFEKKTVQKVTRVRHIPYMKIDMYERTSLKGLHWARYDDEATPNSHIISPRQRLE
jgi:hypothetical protein